MVSPQNILTCLNRNPHSHRSCVKKRHKKFVKNIKLIRQLLETKLLLLVILELNLKPRLMY